MYQLTPHKVPITPPRQAGVLSTSGPLTHVAFVEGQPGITSEPDYPIALDATWVQGSDYIKGDPDGKHSRLEVDSLAEDKKTGGLVRFRYTGVVDMAGPAGKVLRGDGDAATTDFGDICEHPLPSTSVLVGFFIILCGSGF